MPSLTGRATPCPSPPPRRAAPQGNQLAHRILITDGAQLVQKNFWVDDCILPIMPFNCFTETTGGDARVTLQDVTMSDATCTRIRDSKGASTMIFAARYAKALTVKIKQIDERSLRVVDTGWIPYIPPTASWRLMNVTFSCTGNVTHALPPSDGGPPGPPWSQVAVNGLVAVLVVAASFVYWTRTRGESSPRAACPPSAPPPRRPPSWPQECPEPRTTARSAVAVWPRR
jgi:hypothetical protein